MRIKAYAKINLRLEVENKRTDGYHVLQMLNAKISMHDDIYIKRSKENKVTFSDLSLNNITNNYILDIVKEMTSMSKLNYCYSIYIKKRIPQGAGLGGGSSDAASIIKYLNKDLKLNLSIEKLEALGLKYGADIPYCLHSDICIVKGIGEIIQPTNIKLNQKVIILYPNIVLSTKHVFENNIITSTPLDTNKIIYYLTEKKYNNLLHNDLEASAFKLSSELANIKLDLEKYGNVIMSGSGSSFILIYHNISDKLKVEKKYKSKFFIKTYKIL